MQSRNFQYIVRPWVLKQFQTTQNIESEKHFWQENRSLRITFNPQVSVNRLSNNPWNFFVHYQIDHVLCNSGEWLFWFWDFNNIESTHPFSFSSWFLLMFTGILCLGIFFCFLVTDFGACWLALWSLWRFWALFSPSCVELIVVGFLKEQWKTKELVHTYCVGISSYGCTREIWRKQEKRSQKQL